MRTPLGGSSGPAFVTDCKDTLTDSLTALTDCKDIHCKRTARNRTARTRSARTGDACAPCVGTSGGAGGCEARGCGGCEDRQCVHPRTGNA